MTTTHTIEGTDKLLMDTIERQAGDIVDGWRELLQNGLDAPGASEVTLDFDTRHTVVTDDGDGVDLGTDRGLALLKNLGETTKDDDPAKIGEFGVGKGQAVAKARTVFISGETALHFDVKAWGLEVKTVPVPSDRAVDGFRAVLSHYDDEVPSEGSYKWGRFEDRIAERFKYTGVASDTDVVVNGDTVSDAQIHNAVGGDYSVVEHDPQSEADFMAALEPAAGGEVSVYSAGLFVKDVDGNGVSGVVVTRDNLRLNHARNEIQSGCPVWETVGAWLEDRTAELLEDLPEGRMTSDGRAFLAQRKMSGDGEFDPSEPMFKTVDGRQVSLDDISSASQIAFDRADNVRARKLAQGWDMTILDTNDGATARLQQQVEALEEAMSGSMPDEFEVDQKADEVSLPDTHRSLHDHDLNSLQAQKLAVAREIASRLDLRATVSWGESEISETWREDFTVYVTNDAAPARARAAWIPQVFRAVVREGVRSGDTRGDDERATYERRKMGDHLDEHTEVMVDLITEAERGGVEEAVSEQFTHLLA